MFPYLEMCSLNAAIRFYIFLQNSFLYRHHNAKSQKKNAEKMEQLLSRPRPET